jgi:hypothetical protein
MFLFSQVQASPQSLSRAVRTRFPEYLRCNHDIPDSLERIRDEEEHECIPG